MPNQAAIGGSSVEVDGSRLRDMRKLQGDNLRTFAEKVGISIGFVSQIERGWRPSVGPAVFVRICDTLGIDTDQRHTLMSPAARRRHTATMERVA
jgi:transcriptional regulator with XRE-family HTH domain